MGAVMFPEAWSILKEVTGVIDRRFFAVTLFPSLLFWGLLIALVVVSHWNLYTAVKSWNEQEDIFKMLQILGFIVWVTFFAIILSSRLNTILRFYEGYWNFPLGRYIQAIGIKRHQKHLERLTVAGRYEEIDLLYPLPTQSEQVMPTRLGNIMRNAELYPMVRYRIYSTTIWPRLYNLLPERFLQTIATARAALDFMLVMSMLSGAFAILAGGYLIIIGATWQLFPFPFLGGLLVAWLTYQSALSNAMVYAQQFKATFDLYRNELLKQMHLPLPRTPNDEKILWSEVSLFLYRNVHEKPELWNYTDATSPH